LAVAATAALAAFFAYAPAMGGPFLFDDTYLPFATGGYDDATLRDWLRGVRPVLMLTFWANFKLFGREPFSYHVVNVLLHLANAAFVWLILRRFLRDRQELALFGAGLFLLHPLQTESVAYAASRSESLAGFFVLAAMALFVSRFDTGVGWPRAIVVVVLFGAACMTKEQAAVFPALLLLTDFWWNPGFTLAGVRRNWRVYLTISVVAVPAVGFIIRVLAAADTAGFRVKDLPWHDYFWTQCRAIWLYVRMFVLPYGQNVDPEFAISRGPLDHGAILGLAALAAAAGGAWLLRRRFPMAAYGWLWFLVMLAPTSSLVPIADPVAERRVYLPMVGLVMIALDLLSRWNAKKATIGTALAVVLVVAAELTRNRNQVWASSQALWHDTVAKSPNKTRPRFHLAFSYYELGQCDEAVKHYEKAASLEAPDYRLLMDMALAYDCAGKAEEALDRLRQAAKLEATGHVHAQIGMVLAKRARYAEALEALDQAEKLDPAFGMTYVYRGNIHFIAGDLDKAAAEYRRALALNRRDAVALEALSKVEMRKQGR
jgi:tetratricopeptide (TPR) repeat protein